MVMGMADIITVSIMTYSMILKIRTGTTETELICPPNMALCCFILFFT